MKKNLVQNRRIKTTFLFLGTMFLLITSCSKEEEVAEELSGTEVITSTELQFSDETEMISEEVTAIAEDVFASDEISFMSKIPHRSDFLPDCAAITTEVTETTRNKTIDFGEGCELPNGNVLSGIVHLSYAKDMEAATKTLKMELENFTFNGIAVEGGADILRERSNANENPQSTAEASFVATWPDDATASFEGTRTREWVEGYGTKFWGDNVFLITGKRTYVGREGNTFTKEIVSPLRREMSCRFIVSGVVEITRNENTASLDFGDGSCDANGVLTQPDGTEKEIFLRRFKKK